MHAHRSAQHVIPSTYELIQASFTFSGDDTRAGSWTQGRHRKDCTWRGQPRRHNRTFAAAETPECPRREQGARVRVANRNRLHRSETIKGTEEA